VSSPGDKGASLCPACGGLHGERLSKDDPRWPECQWCHERATHVFLHKRMGVACSHFACPTHAGLTDGQHEVHEIEGLVRHQLTPEEVSALTPNACPCPDRSLS
jgi:hypothetical protein